MTLIELIRSDLARLQSPSLYTFFKWYFFPQGSMFHHDVWLRVLQKCKEKRVLKYTVGIIVYFIERHWAITYGVHANANISIGLGLQVVHGDGVFLNCKSIGDNFTCYPNVTVGSNGSEMSIPTIENNVTIYSGAVVVGDITLHEGCIIAANAFVNFDVEANTIVGGVPAKRIGIVSITRD